MHASQSAEPLSSSRCERASRQAPSFWTLTLGSIGVVYGDIGTSPLYALKESLIAAAAGGDADAGDGARRRVTDALGAHLHRDAEIRARSSCASDNNGEGGTLTLMALVQRVHGPQRVGRSLCSGWSARPCSTATRSSRQPFPCSRPSRA